MEENKTMENKINIELIEFYGYEKNDANGFLLGSLTVRLSDFGIDIRSVFAKREKGRWFFDLPYRKVVDSATGELVRFPVVSFYEREKTKALMAAIREQAPEFIERRLADIENPVIFPSKKQVEPQPRKQPEKREESKSNAEERQIDNDEPKRLGTPVVEKVKSVPSIAVKNWQDPPKRKPILSKR